MDDYAVLIVDDDDGDRKMLTRLLAKTTLVVTTQEARSTDELGDVEATHLDAVFLDYLLPGAFGLNVLETVRSRWPQAAVFMVTGQGDEELAKSAIQLGAADYIAKSSITAAALERMLRTGVGAARTQSKLDEQHRDLATFSEVLVHDFKAPIRAVSYLVDQVSEDIEAGEMEDVHESLRLLRKSSRHMLETMKSLSDHIRFDREDVINEVSGVDLVDRAMNALSQVITEADARIDLDQVDATTRLSCRAPQIAQVLQNLIANAIKFCSADAPRIAISVQNRCDSHLFEVSDNGIGIAKDQIERVFEPFKRAPGTTGIAGTGLGLATCKKIVLRHGGRIWCESTPDKGTKFAFELPNRSAQEATNLALVG
ncbi:ATP-binding protein [Roseivivax sp. THAF197b]|uniref:sensor histidine kinase n=1 Tax=Roseivivax sp. THAF197b TaxID=2588299 RepID=UPI0012A8CDF2|nr:hybrid sensor histidine kinase/response regulator [Roseivivax sp. THAF197b]QFS83500.1 Phytochrome-like protein cph1 [Roseivivax sp. THAF197b]